jgi:type III pantothenate kinase
MREALHERAPQLPESGGDYHDFAADTKDALTSGCQGAALALIDYSRAAAQAQLGVSPRLVVHGGGAEELAACLPDATQVASLVLEGLAIWASVESASSAP